MGRVAVVTGGTRGIGAATARQLAAAGYVVAVGYHANGVAALAFNRATGIPVFRWDVADYQACEAAVQTIADKLGPKGVRVNAISAGPVETRAASGIAHFDEMVTEAAAKAPLHRSISSDEVGRAKGFVWRLLWAVVVTLAGLCIYFHPWGGALALTLVLGASLVAQGVIGVGHAVSHRHAENSHWAWMAAGGVATAVLGGRGARP